MASVVNQMGLANDYEISSPLTQNYVDALDFDFDSISSLFLERINDQWVFYSKSLKKVQYKFNVYPNQIRKVHAENSVVKPFFRLNDLLSSERGEMAPLFWSEIDEAFKHAIVSYNNEIKNIWSEIEKLDKFRNDHGRFQFAKWGLILAGIGLLFGQADDIIENLKILYSWF